jgi:hypothetical protein
MLKKKSNSHESFQFLLKVKKLRMKLKHGLCVFKKEIWIMLTSVSKH